MATTPRKAAAKKPAAKKSAPAKKATAAKRAPARKAPSPAGVTAPAAVVDPRTLAIETRQLVRSFKAGVEAVRGVDLAVREGEVFGFLGPNGAGKTTMVRMLCTLTPITSGTATVAGVDVAKEPAKVRRRIGVALQEIGLDPFQSGREILELQAGLYGLPDAKARAQELLELVGLTEAADRRTKTYSGGMKRRLDLATGLVHSPEILFLDEPTTGLDPASRLTVWAEVRRINASGTTVFLTTQYLEEADQLCDRLAIIDDGRIVAEGTPEQLKSEIGRDVVSIAFGRGTSEGDAQATRDALRTMRGVDRVVVERDRVDLYVDNGAGAIPEVVRRIDGAGLKVGAISVARPTLDDVFLKATGRRLEGAEDKTEEES